MMADTKPNPNAPTVWIEMGRDSSGEPLLLWYSTSPLPGMTAYVPAVAPEAREVERWMFQSASLDEDVRRLREKNRALGDEVVAIRSSIERLTKERDALQSDNFSDMRWRLENALACLRDCRAIADRLRAENAALLGFKARVSGP